MHGDCASAVILWGKPETTEFRLGISPGRTIDRMSLLPSIKLIDILTLPSSRNRTVEGSSPSLIRTVVHGQYRCTPSDPKSFIASPDKFLKKKPDLEFGLVSPQLVAEAIHQGGSRTFLSSPFRVLAFEKSGSYRPVSCGPRAIPWIRLRTSIGTPFDVRASLRRTRIALLSTRSPRICAQEVPFAHCRVWRLPGRRNHWNNPPCRPREFVIRVHESSRLAFLCFRPRWKGLEERHRNHRPESD
jgi:hypothetical protein